MKKAKTPLAGGVIGAAGAGKSYDQNTTAARQSKPCFRYEVKAGKTGMATQRFQGGWILSKFPGAKRTDLSSFEARCLSCWAPDAIYDVAFQPAKMWCPACGAFQAVGEHLAECGWPLGPFGVSA